MKKLWNISLLAAVLLVQGITVSASMETNYNALYSKHQGDPNYIYSTESDGKEVLYIIADGKNGETYTLTNLRKEPSPESKILTTIETGTVCSVYGYSNNGWLKIYCPNSPGGEIDGWIREDLLNQTPKKTETPSTPVLSENDSLPQSETELTPDEVTEIETEKKDDAVKVTAPGHQVIDSSVIGIGLETEPEENGMMSGLALG